MILRVVKLGGSLLDLPDLSYRMNCWLGEQPVGSNVIVVGGGIWAEAVRTIDLVHKMDEVAAHWLCIRAMSISAHLAATLLDLPVVDERSELMTNRSHCSNCVFDTHRFLKHDEPSLPGTPLPHGWHVTSDSIAARLADTLAADELVLLKSTLPRAPFDLASAIAQKLVDPWFPQAAQSLKRVRVVDLRAPNFPERSIVPIKRTAPAAI
jgi:aspartokinase-like uncharacterized kinase